MEGDHKRGDLVNIGPSSVKIKGIPVISVIKDRAVPDLQGHPTGPADPKDHSNHTYVYEGS